jgi:hypothetical protein
MRRLVRLISVAAAAALVGGCVEAYEGSWMEFQLGTGVTVPEGDFPGDGQAPSGTHFEFWVVTNGNAFHLADFQVVPTVHRDAPCFIEDDESIYPGLHSTQIYERILDDVANPADPTPAQKDALADAFVRENNQALVEDGIKSVVSYDPDVDEATLTALEMALPPREMRDEASNKMRLAVCTDFFKNHPLYYFGNDKIFSLPLSGVFYGMVAGQDPRNGAPLGGAGFSVPVTFEEFDELWLNWQFNDDNDPRIAGDGTRPGYGPSVTGYHYMSGPPQKRTRGVINVPMVNRQFGSINGEVAIYPAIDEDDVHF